MTINHPHWEEDPWKIELSEPATLSRDGFTYGEHVPDQLADGRSAESLELEEGKRGGWGLLDGIGNALDQVGDAFVRAFGGRTDRPVHPAFSPFQANLEEATGPLLDELAENSGWIEESITELEDKAATLRTMREQLGYQIDAAEDYTNQAQDAVSALAKYTAEVNARARASLTEVQAANVAARESQAYVDSQLPGLETMATEQANLVLQQQGVLTSLQAHAADIEAASRSVDQALENLRTVSSAVESNEAAVNQAKLDAEAAASHATRVEELLAASEQRLEQVQSETAAALAALDGKLYGEGGTISALSEEVREAWNRAVAVEAEALTSTVIEYAVNTSRTSAPTTGWSTSTPTPTEGQQVWMRAVNTYGDNNVVTTNPALITGNTGEPGNDGADGLPGKDGVGIDRTSVAYVVTTSGTTTPSSGWSSTVPTLVQGRYLWTRTAWTYTNGSTEYGYSVAYLSKDGSNGTDGLPGKDGTTLKSTAVTYAVSTSGTTAPTSGWSSSVPTTAPGQFVWTRTIWTYSDNTSETAYSVGKIGDTGATGAKGDTGATGTSVSSVTPFYRFAASKPGTPTGTANPSGWSTTEPAYVKGQALWRTERMIFSNGTATWTPVSAVSALEAMKKELDDARTEITQEITTSANGKNTITRSNADPSGNGKREGDIWWRVDGDDHIIGQWTWSGAAWKVTSIDSEVIANLDVGKLTAGTIKTDEQVVNKIWADGIAAKAITTAALSVGAANLYRDPALLEPAGFGYRWNPDQGYGGGGSVLISSSPLQTGAYDSLYSNVRPTILRPGEKYYISAMVRPSATVPVGKASVYIRAYGNPEASGTYTWASPSSVRNTAELPANVWSKIEGHFTMHETNEYAVIGFYVERNVEVAVRFSDPYLVRLLGSTMIEDGAITTDKIEARTITAEKIESKVLSDIDAAQNDAIAALGEAQSAMLRWTLDDTQFKAIQSAYNGTDVDWKNRNQAILSALNKTDEAQSDATEALTDIVNMTYPDQSAVALVPGSDRPAWYAGAEAGGVDVHTVASAAAPVGTKWIAGTDKRIDTYPKPETVSVTVQPGVEYEITFWAKATVKDSILVIYIWDENGHRPGRFLRPIQSPQPSSRGTFTYMDDPEYEVLDMWGKTSPVVRGVSTTWKRYGAVVTFDAARSIRVGTIYWNHPDGAQGGTQYLADLTIRPAVANQHEVDTLQNAALEEIDGALRTLENAVGVTSNYLDNNISVVDQLSKQDGRIQELLRAQQPYFLRMFSGSRTVATTTGDHFVMTVSKTSAVATKVTLKYKSGVRLSGQATIVYGHSTTYQREPEEYGVRIKTVELSANWTGITLPEVSKDSDVMVIYQLNMGTPGAWAPSFTSGEIGLSPNWVNLHTYTAPMNRTYHSVSATINMSSVSRGDKYEFELLVGGKVVDYLYTAELGPLTIFGDGRRTITLQSGKFDTTDAAKAIVFRARVNGGSNSRAHSGGYLEYNYVVNV